MKSVVFVLFEKEGLISVWGFCSTERGRSIGFSTELSRDVGEGELLRKLGDPGTDIY